MPSYAPPKPKPVKGRAAHRKTFNLEWIIRATDSIVLMRQIQSQLGHGTTAYTHLGLAITTLESVNRNCSNATAAKQFKTAQHLACIALGLKRAPDIG